MSLTSPKGKAGLPRLIDAAACSMRGIAAAFRHEEAFRLDVLLAIVLVPTACLVHVSAVERAVLIASMMLVLVVEILNSAIEATVDRISLERHPLAGRAKDMGSAAVFLSLVNLAAAWGFILLG
jgi:diacylglycerol kinase (ATP)